MIEQLSLGLATAHRWPRTVAALAALDAAGERSESDDEAETEAGIREWVDAHALVRGALADDFDAMGTESGRRSARSVRESTDWLDMWAVTTARMFVARESRS